MNRTPLIRNQLFFGAVMRHLLVLLLCVVSVHCSAQGVVYVGDIDSVPASVLESPRLPASLDERPVAPSATYLPMATDQQQEIQLTAAHTYADNKSQKAKNNPSTIKKTDSKKSSFFSKMKPTWLFGDDEKSGPPKDPFLANSSNKKNVYRNEVAPIATYDPSQEIANQPSVTNAAYSQSKFTRPSFGTPKSTAKEKPKSSLPSTTSAKTTKSQSQPRHIPGGIAMRKSSQPKGILNHLGWMNGDEEPSKPTPAKPKQQFITKNVNQPKPQPAKIEPLSALPKASETHVFSKGPASVVAEPAVAEPVVIEPQVVAELEIETSKVLSAKNHGVPGFDTEPLVDSNPDFNPEDAIFTSDLSTPEKSQEPFVATPVSPLSENPSQVLELVEVESPVDADAIEIEQAVQESLVAEDEIDLDDVVFVENKDIEISKAELPAPTVEKEDPLAILEREIVQPALNSLPSAKTSSNESVTVESPFVDSPQIAEVQPELPLPTIQKQPVQILPTRVKQEEVQLATKTEPVTRTAEPQPIPSATVQPKPIIARTAPRVNPTKNPFVKSRAIVDPNKEPTERSRILLSEAHGMAQDANSLEQYTAIVQRCRYVLAIDDAPIAVNYANELASWALNKRGEDLLDKGRNAEATVDFHDAVHCDSDCWRAIHNLGVLQAQSGDYATAAKHFNRALDLNPEYAKAYANRAALHIQSADYQKALEDYQRAIQIDPDLSMAHAGRGRVCHMLGYLEQALRHLDAAQLLTPSDATICLGRGDLLVDLGRYGQARQAYLHAIELEPESANAYRNLAWMQATCPSNTFRNGEEALANAIRATELSRNPDDITLDTHAAALAALGRFDEAVDLIKKAIEIAPASDVTAYSERLQMYLRGEAFYSQPFGMVESASFETEPSSTH